MPAATRAEAPMSDPSPRTRRFHTGASRGRLPLRGDPELVVHLLQYGEDAATRQEMVQPFGTAGMGPSETVQLLCNAPPLAARNELDDNSTHKRPKLGHQIGAQRTVDYSVPSVESWYQNET